MCSFSVSDESLNESAMEWQKIQLAVLGFTGVCGLLQNRGTNGMPLWLQTFGLISAAVGFLLAVAAVFLVWTIADRADVLRLSGIRGRRRLKVGIGMSLSGLTFVVLAALCSWWPHREAPSDTEGNDVVFVVTASFDSICGRVTDSRKGFVTLENNARRTQVPLNRVAALRLVQHC